MKNFPTFEDMKDLFKLVGAMFLILLIIIACIPFCWVASLFSKNDKKSNAPARTGWANQPNIFGDHSRNLK